MGSARLAAAAAAAACLTLCACSDGIYSATSAGDGNVVVVNRITGEARSIRGDTVVDLKSDGQNTGHTPSSSAQRR
jgi:hypothetical protein